MMSATFTSSARAIAPRSSTVNADAPRSFPAMLVCGMPVALASALPLIPRSSSSRRTSRATETERPGTAQIVAPDGRFLASLSSVWGRAAGEGTARPSGVSVIGSAQDPRNPSTPVNRLGRVCSERGAAGTKVTG